jgi:CBS domain-containing protein
LLFGAGAAIGASGGPGVAVAAATWLAVMNGVLAVFNLLPGAPLDGGRVLRAVLWRHYGDRGRAERGAARAGRVLGAVMVGVGIGELLAFRSFSGLWLMLIGWFLITAAAAEEKAAAAKAALAGVRVADVMTADPDLAGSWETIEEFAGRAAARSRQDAFPVVGPGGDLAGVVLASQLARIPAGDRNRLRLDQVALAVPPDYRAAPDDPAGPLLTRRPLGGQVAAVVHDGGRVMGLVTIGDLQRALRRRTLAGARP